MGGGWGVQGLWVGLVTAIVLGEDRGSVGRGGLGGTVIGEAAGGRENESRRRSLTRETAGGRDVSGGYDPRQGLPRGQGVKSARGAMEEGSMTRMLADAADVAGPSCRR